MKRPLLTLRHAYRTRLAACKGPTTGNSKTRTIAVENPVCKLSSPLPPPPLPPPPSPYSLRLNGTVKAIENKICLPTGAKFGFSNAIRSSGLSRVVPMVGSTRQGVSSRETRKSLPSKSEISSPPFSAVPIPTRTVSDLV